MPKATGFSALAALTTFTAKKWFTKSFVDLVEEISLRYTKRTEILDGGLVSKGTHLSATVCDLDVGEMKIIIGGVLTTVGAISEKDCIAPEGGGFGQAIFSDGSNGNTLSLTSTARAFITIIVCNSDGGGSTSATPLVIAVINGTGTSPTATAHISTAGINAALAASTGIHAGVTEWAHVGRFEVLEGTFGALQSNTENRNNHLRA
jgi:hypothetical protein